MILSESSFFRFSMAFYDFRRPWYAFSSMGTILSQDLLCSDCATFSSKGATTSATNKSLAVDYLSV